MTTVSVLIPTLSGRERWLRRTVDGYIENTPSDIDLELVILRDRPTCGIGWQEAADRAHGDYLHFSNDDVYPWEGWLPPLIEAVEGDMYVAAPWISHGPWGQFYAAPEGQVATDWAKVDHSAMPFMSRRQRTLMGPIIATHYGVDNWMARRIRASGMTLVGRTPSVICHFASPIGREPAPGWTEIDLLDYDCGIALPEYEAGMRDPLTLPPDRLTPEGLARAREWRKENVL